MGRGHGGTGRSTWRGGGGSALERSLSAREDEIRGSYNERVSIFDENGNEIFRNDNGQRNQANYNQGLSQNNVVTHSHPFNNSFSSDDIIDGAIRHNMREMRAVAPNYTFSMKRPEGGWGVSDFKSFGKARSTYSKIEKRVTREMMIYTKNYKGDPATAIRRANLIGTHRINKEFARVMGYEYSARRTR